MVSPPTGNRENPHPCEKIKIKTCDDTLSTTGKPPPAGKKNVVKAKPENMKNVKTNAKGLVDKALTAISKSSGTQQLLIGSVSGW